MGRKRRVAAIVTALMTLAPLASAGALTRDPADEAAMKPTRQPADQNIEARVNGLLSKMTLDEKLQQIQLLSDGQVTDDDAKKGVGGVFSLVDPQKINHLQHVAVEQSRLHIPIVYGVDAVHGHNNVLGATKFPQQIGVGATWDPQLAEQLGESTSRAVKATGPQWDFAPVEDISRDTRWGRYYET